jgi:CheY-like chemotaxis protein
VETCLSGTEAIKLVKRQNYDLVFMDHMMPEMDGIETTETIRAWEQEEYEKSGLRKQVPIIALTANVVSGMRELFLEKGFNDFLAKPIDVSKLDEMLDRWISKDKREDRKKLVLIVDDNPANLKSGRNVLLKTYNVITAPSAEKVFKLLENNSPDIILFGAEMSPPENMNKWSDKVIYLNEPFDSPVIVEKIENYFQKINGDMQ